MRTISAGIRAILAARQWRVTGKVWIEDPDGVMRDVTAFQGANWFDTAQWSEDADQPVASGTITLVREDLDLGVSLAPAIGASPANRNAADDYAPFLKEGRAFRIEAAVTAATLAPIPADFVEVMRGYIDTVRTSADRNEMRLDFRDPGAALLDYELVDSKVYADDDDGMLLEDIIQTSLDDVHGVGVYPLSVPVSPATVMRNITIGDGKHLERLRDLAFMIGWELRYRYDALGVMRLTLYEPRRTFAPGVDAPDTTFAANEYTAIPRLDTGIADVRNFIRVGFRDITTGQRNHVDVTDPASIAAYRTRFMELNYADDGNINTLDEATTLANAALSDLSTPYSDHDVVTIPLYWPAQIGDAYQFDANGIVYDDDQTFGVVGFTHTLAADGGETTFVTKGKVVGAVKEWKRRARVVLGPSDAEQLDELRVRNFREIRRTPSVVTYGWDPDARAVEQWLWIYTYDQPVTSDPWPRLDSPNPIRLTAATNEYTFAIPATGKISYALLVPLDSDYKPGTGQRITIHPLDAVPVFDNFSHAPGADGLHRDAAFTVLDPGGFGGSLRVWVAQSSPDDAVPTGLPEGTYAIVATPAIVGPATSFVLAGGGAGNLLDEIRVHPGRGKRIYAEFVNALGISSGIVSFVLLSSGGPVDPSGDLLAGIIKLATQFASTIKPVSVYSGLPASGYVGEVALNLTDAPPKLYRWTGSAWTAATPTSDLSGQINTAQIADAAVSAQKIADAAVSTVKIALGAVTADILAAAAVTTTKIADDSISTPKLIAGSITTPKIAAGAVTATEIAALTILAGNIAAGQITAAKIASHTITAAEIAALTITAAELAAGSISTAKLQANAITSNELASDSVIAGKIAAGAISTAALQAGAVTAGKISVSTLASLATDAGIIVAGKLQNAGGTQYLDLNASGSNGFLVHPKLVLRANGAAEFGGDVTITDAASGIYFKDSGGNTVGRILVYFSGGVGNGVVITAWQLGGGGTSTDFVIYDAFAAFQNSTHNAVLYADILRLWDTTNTLAYNIKIGAANSGGAGFRMLRIDN